MTRFSMMTLCLALVSLTATGCIFTSDDTSDDDDGPPVPTEAAINYSWSITAGGAPSDCATNNIVTASFLATRDSDQMGFDDKFTCSDMQGVSGPVGLNL
jgi:hypothetical protein